MADQLELEQERAPARGPLSPAQKAAATRRSNGQLTAAARAASPGPPKRWAREYDACIECGGTDKEHVGKGLCIRCRDKHRAAGSKKAGGEHAPLRGTAKLSAAKQRNVKSLLVLTVAGLDMGAARLVPQHWTAEDRLQQDETASLVKAIYAELESWPKVIEWIAAAAEQGVHAQLGLAIAMVALPRLVRRNLVPADVAFAVLLATSQAGANQPQPQPDPVPVAAGADGQPDRHDGNGQVYAGFVPGRDAPIHSGVSEQAG